MDSVSSIDNGRIYRLDVSSCSTVTVLPAEIGDLERLMFLDASGNQLASLPPENDLTYDWIVPDNASAGVRVRVSADTASDQSDDVFDILAAQVRTLDPFSQTGFSFSIADQGTVYRSDVKIHKVQIYNPPGSLVKEIIVNTFAIHWDRRGRDGTIMPPGTYAARLFHQQGTLDFQFVLTP
ncbi:hypothetical protein ACFL5V_13670 [Fibrobacterota bacterium]